MPDAKDVKMSKKEVLDYLRQNVVYWELGGLPRGLDLSHLAQFHWFVDFPIHSQSGRVVNTDTKEIIERGDWLKERGQ